MENRKWEAGNGCLECSCFVLYAVVMEQIHVDLDKPWLSVADICEYMDVSTFVVTSVESAGAGAVLVHTENGLGGEVTTNWIRRGIFDIFASADWWWVLDIDEGCIETQTAPTSIGTLRKDNNVGQVIESSTTRFCIVSLRICTRYFGPVY